MTVAVAADLACDHMQNLRVAIAVKAKRAAEGGKHASKEGHVAQLYLERYLYLILFAAWLSEARGTSFQACVAAPPRSLCFRAR